MLGKVLSVSTLFSLVVLSALLQTTAPSTIHPVGILFIFLLIYMLALGVLTFLFYMVFLIKERKLRRAGVESKNLLKRAYIYGLVTALFPVMIIGVASIGKIGLYEVILILTFEFVACFYIYKQG